MSNHEWLAAAKKAKRGNVFMFIGGLICGLVFTGLAALVRPYPEVVAEQNLIQLYGFFAVAFTAFGLLFRPGWGLAIGFAIGFFVLL